MKSSVSTSPKKQASVFDLNGMPSFTKALPLALQHVVAMIVGCVTPAIIIAGVANLSEQDRVILIQAALFVSAFSTLLQLFPFIRLKQFQLGSALPVIMGISFAYVPSMQAIAERFDIGTILGAQIIGGIIALKQFQLGSALPVIMGISFAYVPSMQAIAERFDIGTILGAQIIGGIIAILVGITVQKIRVLFPPIITGTVVFTIGLSLYPTAINYMAGGTSSPSYGSWQNWLVAFFTLAVVTGLNHFTKGFLKLASILIGIIAGYIMAALFGLVEQNWLVAFFTLAVVTGLNHFTKGFLKLASILIGIIAGYIMAALFGLVDLSQLQTAGYFQLPRPFHFSIHFEPSACIAIGTLFAINSIQAIGDFSATTVGSMNREPENRELQGGILMYGITNILGSVFGGLPTATYSQNVGIVTTTKVINRFVLGLAAVILMIAGFVPKFSALLTTIPQCVLGGATISVFASIAMTGIKLIMRQKMNFRNTAIVGLSVALGMGITQAPQSLATFPEWVTMIFGKSPVVLATITAILLNVILPKEEDIDNK